MKKNIFKILILIIVIIVIIAVFAILYRTSKSNSELENGKLFENVAYNEKINNTEEHDAELYIDTTKMLLFKKASPGLKYIFEISNNEIISSGTQTDYKTEDLALSMVDQLKQAHADTISDYKIYSEKNTVTYIRIFSKDERIKIYKFICDNIKGLITEGQKLYIYQGSKTNIFSSMPTLLKEISDDKKLYTSELFNDEYTKQSVETTELLDNYYLIYNNSKYKISVSQTEKEYEGKTYKAIIIDSKKI